MQKFNLTWLKNQIAKPSQKNVFFESLTKTAKIEYLEGITETEGKTKTFKKSVKVANLSKDMKMTLIAEYAKDNNLDAITKIANGDENFTTDINIVLSYDKMNDFQKLDFLKLENPEIKENTEVQINVFAGKNIINLLQEVRNLTEEEFLVLISK